MKMRVRGFLVVAMLALVAGCGDDVRLVDPPPALPNLEVNMDPAEIIAQVGQIVEFAVNSTGNNGEKSWVCSSSDAAVMAVISIPSGCRALALTPGRTSIKVVMSNGVSSANAVSQVTVMP